MSLIAKDFFYIMVVDGWIWLGRVILQILKYLSASYKLT